MKNIAIFASGSGSNAENIIRHFSENENLNITTIYSNNCNAYVLERAKKFNIPIQTFNRSEFYDSPQIMRQLKDEKVDMIVLAGFLWLIPENLVNNFTIINIHPALLPKYGGKGMYGHHVHEAVVENKEKESGITIHYVDAKYDEGNIIFQAKCEVLPTDSPEDVAEKVHQLEYEHFPKVIDDLLFNS